MPRTLLIALLSIAFSAQAQEEDCDRDCLSRFLDGYLGALVAGDPSAAPLSHGFRQTENAVAVAQGEGLWSKVTSLGELQRRYYDPVAGAAGYFGLLDEGGSPAVGALRLKVEGGQITEAEWHVGRSSHAGLQGEPGTVYFDADNLVANPPAQGSVPPAQRHGRNDLIAIANSYFDGITNSNSQLIKGQPGCSRLENGYPTYGQPLSEGQSGHNGVWDCRTQADFGIALVGARRTQVVDVEQQVVMMSAVFIRRPGNPRWRNHFTEVFSIKDGLIGSVHAAMFYPSPTQPVPNWPPYDGNFPLPAELGN